VPGIQYAAHGDRVRHRFYLRSHERHQHLLAGNAAAARALAAWNQRIRDNWGQVAIESVDALPETETAQRRPSGSAGARPAGRPQLRRGLGGTLSRHARRRFRDLRCGGRSYGNGEPQAADGVYIFAAHSAACRESGMHGYTVRILPTTSTNRSSFCPA